MHTLKNALIVWLPSSVLKSCNVAASKASPNDNKQIKSLNAFDATQEEIGLCRSSGTSPHQNGIVNNRLQEHFPAANLNDEYRMTLDEFLTRVGYLVQAIDAFDAAAGKDYQLAASS